MAMSKAQKKVLKEATSVRLQTINAAIIAEYRGLSVAELTDLRVKLREVKAEFRVVKNRVARVAIKESAPKAAAIADKLKGPIGLVLAYGDTAAAAKVLLEFAKDKENFKVHEAVMDGKALSSADLKAISELPSREVLLARIVGTLVSPQRGLVTVLSGVTRQLVQVINAIKEKKA